MTEIALVTRLSRVIMLITQCITKETSLRYIVYICLALKCFKDGSNSAVYEQQVPHVDSARVMTLPFTTTATGQQRLSIQKNAQEMQPFSALRAVLSPVSSLAAAPRALLSTVWETFREALQQEVLID